MNVQGLIDKAQRLVDNADSRDGTDPSMLSIACSLLAIAKCLAAKMEPGYITGSDGNSQPVPVDRGPQWGKVDDDETFKIELPF